MAIDEGANSLTDKQYQFFGANRWFFTGLNLISGSGWTAIDFSGVGGFGANQAVLGHRFMIVKSGTSAASAIEWSWDGGTTIAGTTRYAASLSFDGISKSGVAVRATATLSGQIYVW